MFDPIKASKEIKDSYLIISRPLLIWLTPTMSENFGKSCRRTVW